MRMVEISAVHALKTDSAHTMFRQFQKISKVRLFAVLLPGLLVWTAESARAEEPSKAARFVRVSFDEKGITPQYMETAIARYVPKGKTDSDVYVDLIGAVHVGDKAYYDQLNKEFENYDAMLFELVAPKGTRIPKGTKDKGTGSAVSKLQIMLKQALALEFQLEQIDYEKSNFVHADMTPEQFSQSMKDKNEDAMTMFLRLMQASAKMQAENKNPPSDLVLMAALFDRQRGPAILKRIFADQLANADVLLEALNGPQGSTIITERNRVALDTLEDEMEAGKKKLALFYGAAHLPDMEKRLLDRFKMERSSIRWVRAWDLTVPPASKKKPGNANKLIPKTSDSDPSPIDEPDEKKPNAPPAKSKNREKTPAAPM